MLRTVVRLIDMICENNYVPYITSTSGIDREGTLAAVLVALNAYQNNQDCKSAVEAFETVRNSRYGVGFSVIQVSFG